jgi:DNA-binding NarL/FixJ family response regulator
MIRVLIVDDHKIMCEGLASLLGQQPDLEVVGFVHDGAEAVKKCNELEPDTVIMDISMPNLNGIEATRRIIRDHKKTKIIALSIHSDKQFVVQFLNAGGKGYIVKSCAFEDITRAIYTVYNGEIFLSPPVAGPIVDDYLKLSSYGESSTFSPLTPREREILQLTVEGCHNSTIATKLCITQKTVESHRHNIMKKLGAKSVIDLTKYAIKHGLVQL